MLFNKKSSEEFFGNLVKLLAKLKELGLYGLECYHPSASEQDSEMLVEIAHKLDLKITRGSDYHGPQDKKRV